ncbi:MAG: TIGR03435 family protein [Vicinamibacterales bacterium]
MGPLSRLTGRLSILVVVSVYCRNVAQCVLCLGFLVSGTTLSAQGQGAAPTPFDVTSVKPNRTLQAARRMQFTPNGFNATNVPLKELIRLAYGIDGFAASNQVVNGPAWVDTDTFDVAARFQSGSPAVTQEQRFGALRGLVAERFGVLVHEETRESAVYSLVVNRAGQLGPRLKKMTLDCDAFLNGRPGGPGVQVCGFFARVGQMSGPTTMSSLATSLTRVVDRPVLDKTNLMGAFELTLEWVPDEARVATGDGVSIFTALQEQIGLRLQSERGPIRVLVIDRAERPTAD